MTLADATCLAIQTCTCRRCKGRLVWEPFAFGWGYHWQLGSWRCICCGEFVSIEVLKTRQRLSANEKIPA